MKTKKKPNPLLLAASQQSATAKLMEKMTDEQRTLYGEAQQESESILRKGEWLATTPIERGGLFEYFDEAEGLGIEDPILRAHTAVLMDNGRKWLNGLKRLSEATLAVQVGPYVPYILPIIRASFSNQIARQLVSVQPTTKPSATVWFLNYVIGKTKGNISKGDRVFDARSGYSGTRDYTSENVTDEDQGTTVAGVTQTGNLAQRPVRGGTFRLTIAGVPDIIVRDDGNGGIVFVSGGVGQGVAAGSINYETGAWTVTYAIAPGAGAAMRATYRYNAEVSGDLPQIDIQFVSSILEVEKRSISSQYSMDAAQDMMAEFGEQLSAHLIATIAAFVVTEVSRQIIHDLWIGAGAAVTSFSKTPPVGAAYSRREHFSDMLIELETVDAAMYDATQLIASNWLVVDSKAATVITTMTAGNFERAPQPNVRGVHFIGVLDGRWRVFKDPHLQNEPGAVANGNILAGYKGPDVWDAGYAYVPYHEFYTTAEQSTGADMMLRQAYGSRYATKMINTNFYKRLNLLA